jgi:hypothetical protein
VLKIKKFLRSQIQLPRMTDKKFRPINEKDEPLVVSISTISSEGLATVQNRIVKGEEVSVRVLEWYR